jgi:L-alanine-DL-glutamate epimerase-like enolase superfamily enzyme
VEAHPERWPLRDTFTIARGSKNEAAVVVVTITAGTLAGRGECVPYPRYGETTDSVLEQIDSVRAALGNGMTRQQLLLALPPGAARNACDCALWDLAAKQAGQPVWRLAGLPEPMPVVTAYTLSLAAPAAMAAAAKAHAHRPLLKIKLGRSGVLQSIQAIREAAPRAGLIVDANEAWTAEQLAAWLPHLAALGVDLLEQPLPASQDQALADMDRLIPIAADESAHVASDIERLRGCYDVVNIKLDKAGGLTAALALKKAAESAGLGIMIGCMVSTSLAVAPALMLASGARYVDLDGPLLLARDRDAGLVLMDQRLMPPTAALWG